MHVPGQDSRELDHAFRVIRRTREALEDYVGALDSAPIALGVDPIGIGVFGASWVRQRFVLSRAAKRMEHALDDLVDALCCSALADLDLGRLERYAARVESELGERPSDRARFYLRRLLGELSSVSVVVRERRAECRHLERPPSGHPVVRRPRR